MRELTARTRFIKVKELAVGDVIIKKGTFSEIRAGKFGDTFIFHEEHNEDVGLGASGLLKSLYTRGAMKIGDVLKITFLGKKELTGGRAANDFKVEAFESQLPLFSTQDVAEGEYIPEEGEL